MHIELSLKQVALTILPLVFLLGCASSWLDIKYDDQGNVITLDTESNFESIRYFIDRDIESELVESAPSAGCKDWNTFWSRRLTNLTNNAENPERYSNYVIETRRYYQLPEIVYVPDASCI